ncbi:TPA: hypothetical protein ACGYSL_002402 [Legionella pneumophila]
MKIDLLDVPVYRIKEDKYYRGLAEYLDECMDKLGMQSFLESNPEWRAAHHEMYLKAYGGQWEFNEIIGYIKLFVLGGQVRGEYHQVDAKRIVKTRKKIIELKSLKLVDEIELPSQGSNHEIYTGILDYLNACQKHLKNRYIDLSVFQRIGPYIDWKSLFEWR